MYSIYMHTLAAPLGTNPQLIMHTALCSPWQNERCSHSYNKAAQPPLA